MNWLKKPFEHLKTFFSFSTKYFIGQWNGRIISFFNLKFINNEWILFLFKSLSSTTTAEVWKWVVTQSSCGLWWLRPCPNCCLPWTRASTLPFTVWCRQIFAGFSVSGQRHSWKVILEVLSACKGRLSRNPKPKSNNPRP